MTSPTSRLFSRPARAVLAAIVACAVLAAAPVAEAQRGKPAPRVVKRFKPGVQKAPTALDRNSYLGVRNAALALLRKYPPDRYYIVGVGRSPSRIVAFLRSLSLDGEPQNGDVSPLASNIPASGMKQAPTADRFPEFDRHFDRFLPDDVKEGKRSIVLIDSIGTGASVKNTGLMLQRYFQSRGIQQQVILSGFSQRAPAGFDTLPNSFAGALGQDAADYGQHNIGLQGSRLEDLEAKKNANHTTFRKTLIDYMETDGELDGILEGEFRSLLQVDEPEPAPRAQKQARPNGVPRLKAWGLKSLFRPRAAANGLNTAGYKVTRKEVTYEVLAGPQYADLRAGSLELLKRYPPSKNHRYIGVGRSSSAVLGFLENLGADAGYLPLDGVKKDIKNLAALQPQFDALLAQFLPNDGGATPKTIVLFQGSETGASLPAVKQIVEGYLARRGVNAKVVAVAFTPDGRRTNGVDEIRAQPGLQTIQDDVSKAISKFDYFRVGKTQTAVNPANVRAEYTGFKTKLLDLMSRDPALNEALNESDE